GLARLANQPNGRSASSFRLLSSIDWMVKAADDGLGVGVHAVTEELPRAIFDVMRNVSDRFVAGSNRLRQENLCVWWIGELPIEQATAWVCGRPKITLYVCLCCIGL